MDYKKIGNFIISERKAKNMTQAKLANKLFVSEKTISKWENGNGIPDTNIVPKLCEIFGISANELLNGERISNENYISKAENKLLELQKAKEESDKRLLSMEIVIGLIGTLFFATLIIFAALFEIETWTRILFIVLASVILMITLVFTIRIEQKAGYYECAKCHHKYIPTYNQVLWSMHINRTRYMKCPHCQKKSWNKKVIN